jgi:hypothetical protein
MWSAEALVYRQGNVGEDCHGKLHELSGHSHTLSWCQMYILSLQAERSDQANIVNVRWNIGATEHEEQMSSVYTEQYNYEI